MQAVISGQAGVALLVEGEKLSSIHAGNAGEIIPRRDRDFPYLFQDATDLQFVEDVEVPEVARQLEIATAKADALHLALILLDPQLTPDTRRDAAEELTELLATEGVLEYVEGVLYAHPLPGAADLPGALSCCTGRSEPARQLLLRLQSLQGEISEVYEAWERIPDGVFGTDQDRAYALAVAVRGGIFRNLVVIRASGSLIDPRVLSEPGMTPWLALPWKALVQGWIAALPDEQPQEAKSEEGAARGAGYVDRLVERGRDLESRSRVEVKNQVDQATSMMSSAWNSVADRIDEAVTKALHRMGVPTRDEIRTLTRQVEELNAKLEELKPRVPPAATPERAIVKPPIVTPGSPDPTDPSKIVAGWRGTPSGR